MPTTTNFRISSELKNVIGRDLITDDFVAIFELVKNSFDAHATDVKIFFDFSNKQDAIYIIDNGKGMSETDIQKKWLFVAYSAKQDGSEDAGGSVSHYAGNKGVGRFSCDRLGRNLHLETRNNESDLINVINVDWGNFEGNSKKEFGSIPILLDKQDKFSEFAFLKGKSIKTGVVLKIFGLRNAPEWDHNKIIDLKRALSKLLDPFDGEMSNRRIEIISPKDWDYDKKEIADAKRENRVPITVNGDVENKLFEVIENKTTVIKAKIEANVLKITLIDRGMTIYRTEENIGEDYPLLCDVQFDAIIAFLNLAAKILFKRRMGIPSVQYGSLFLIRNGFRVFPVGEEADDFWGLDRRKQQGFRRFVGTREIQGRVKITTNELLDENFKEASSRNQGLISTPAVEELKQCTMRCLRKLEAYLTTVTWLDIEDKESDSPARLSLDQNKQNIIQLVEKLSLSPKIKVTYYNKDLISILNQKSDEFQTTLDSLRNIAQKNNDTDLLKEIAKVEQKLQKQQHALVETKKIAQQEIEARQKAESHAIKAEQAAKKAEVAKKVVEQQYQEEQKRNLFLTASADRDKEILEGFLHQITMSSADAKVGMENALILLRSGNLSQTKIQDIFTEQLEVLENICTLSKFGTFANFRLNSGMIKGDLCSFFEQYIQKVAKGFESMLELDCSNSGASFVTEFNPIEMGMVIDNLVSNSKKARATKFYIKIITMLDPNGIQIEIIDNGDGIKEDHKRIFERGFTRTNGSGIGLFFCKRILEKIGAEIVVSDHQPVHGASFTIRIPK